MAPTIGRIVHYNAEDGEVYPAIILKVWNPTCVNLEVFGPAPCKYPTSVMQGDEMSSWQWPPRAADSVPEKEIESEKIEAPQSDGSQNG